MTLKPINGKVLIRPVAVPMQSAGGIHLVRPVNTDAPQQGVVVALPEKMGEVPIGANVIFSKYQSTELEQNEQKLLLVAEKDLLAVLE